MLQVLESPATDAATDTGTALDLLAERAAEAAQMLKLLANEHRLLILCQLAALGEAPVSRLGEMTPLSQSALSQHLARLRAQNLVATRRVAQQVFYSVADPRVTDLLMTLKTIYCPEPEQKS